MNWEHLKAFLWLRWRLIANRNKRAGKGSVILQGVLMAIVGAAGVGAFIAGILVGAFVLPRASPGNIMLVWDAIVVAFLFFWLGELLAELQRSELLSLDKFLHLPVSLSGAFLINYVGSLSGLGTLVFLPLMVGLSIGLVAGKGPGMLLMFPLLAGFWLMVTAAAYQLRGWLASIMINPRRRRTVITLATFAFILLVQLPNLIGFASGRFRSRPGSAIAEANRKEIEKLDRALAVREITLEEHNRRVAQIREPARGRRGSDRQELEDTLRVINRYVPLGWLPYGAEASFGGRPGASLLAAAGLAAIGLGSLRRSYRTTVRLYTGQYTAKNSGGSAAAARAAVTSAQAPAVRVAAKRPKGYAAAALEWKVGVLSEHASAIAAAGFRCFARAPEAKFMLLSPLVVIFVFGSSMLRQESAPPELLRPLMISGGYTFMLFMLVGMIGNQFAFDRSGFRTFVLSPTPRKDILIGKNVAIAPFGVGFMLIAALVMQVAYPMRLDHYLAVLLQMIPMYLMYCLVGNVLSIIAPMPVAAGSMKPVKPRAKTMLVHLAFVFIFPLAMAPTLIPLAIEFLLSRYDWLSWFPAYLALTIVECVVVLWVYSRLVDAQGRLLQRREQKILEVVTTKTE